MPDPDSSSSPAGQAGKGSHAPSAGQADRGKHAPSDGQADRGKHAPSAGQADKGKHAPSDGQADRGKHAPSDLASLKREIREWAGSPGPMYTPESVRAVHNLHYDWTGWLSGHATFPDATAQAIRETAPLWEKDGLSLEKHRVKNDQAQILFKVTPQVSPSLFAARVKGRLQHALRQAGAPVKFSRKVSIRTLGENIRAAVEGYLAKQVRKEGFVDHQYAQRLEQFTWENPGVDLAAPSATASGRYWYNLHLVLVTAGRVRMANDATLAAVRDAMLSAFEVKSVSVMPDHVHVALRGSVDRSPENVALEALNRLHAASGLNRLWESGYYVGTFSEYDLNLLRKMG